MPDFDPTSIESVNRAVATLKGGVKFSHPGGITHGGKFVYPTLASPATNIAQAAELLDEMHKDGNNVNVYGDWDTKFPWECDVEDFDTEVCLAHTTAPTKELAICLCWLAWKGQTQ